MLYVIIGTFALSVGILGEPMQFQLVPSSRAIVWGDPIYFELIITNVGSSAVAIPQNFNETLNTLRFEAYSGDGASYRYTRGGPVVPNTVGEHVLEPNSTVTSYSRLSVPPPRHRDLQLWQAPEIEFKAYLQIANNVELGSNWTSVRVVPRSQGEVNLLDALYQEEETKVPGRPQVQPFSTPQLGFLGVEGIPSRVNRSGDLKQLRVQLSESNFREVIDGTLIWQDLFNAPTNEAARSAADRLNRWLESRPRIERCWLAMAIASSAITWQKRPDWARVVLSHIPNAPAPNHPEGHKNYYKKWIAESDAALTAP